MPLIHFHGMVEVKEGETLAEKLPGVKIEKQQLADRHIAVLCFTRTPEDELEAAVWVESKIDGSREQMAYPVEFTQKDLDSLWGLFETGDAALNKLTEEA